MSRYKLYFDGNKTSNGVSCSYLVIDDNGRKIKEETIILPEQTTVPEAEYQGLISGVEYIIQNFKVDELEIFGDSQLVVNQVAGEYECKKPQLRVLRSKTRTLLNQFPSWRIQWVTREKNLVR